MGRFAIDMATAVLLVAEGDGDAACAFNLRTRSYITLVPVGEYANTAVFDQQKNLFFVSASGSGTITVIDPSSLTAIATYQVNADYTDAAIALDKRTQTLYMTNAADRLVSYVSATSGKVEGTVTTGKYAYDSATDDPGSDTLFVCNGNSSVSVIDTTTETLTETIKVGANTTSAPAASALDPTLNQVLVTNAGSDTLVFLKDK